MEIEKTLRTCFLIVVFKMISLNVHQLPSLVNNFFQFVIQQIITLYVLSVYQLTVGVKKHVPAEGLVHLDHHSGSSLGMRH